MWSYDGNIWKSYTWRENNLEKDVYVRALHIDNTGKKWIGTRDALSTCVTNSQLYPKKIVLPIQMTITGNFPNPFNPTTTVEYMIPESGHITIDVYNITGQKVRNLLSENMAPGNYTVVWNGKDDVGLPAASGVYLFRLEMGSTSLSHRMLLMR